LLAETAGQLRRLVGDGRQLDIAQPPDPLHVHAAHKAGSDDRCLELFHEVPRETPVYTKQW